jgi:riboflavin synthase
MFTGLVEGLGVVARLEAESTGIQIAVTPPMTMLAPEPDRFSPTRCGDSVAINGCCLTVISIDDRDWSFQAGRETLSKTNLGRLGVGDLVNLERSLPANGRLGGHFVQGHVDGLGTVDQLDREGEWVMMGFQVPSSIASLLVPKGSVTVDGVSLTIVSAESTRFTVALIPHTLSVTTLGHRSIGQTVNIETDILGKYVKQFLVSIS